MARDNTANRPTKGVSDMKRSVLIGAATAAIMASGAAMAHVDVGISIGVPGVVYTSPPPVYYAPPPPVYYAPPPVRYVERPRVIVVPQRAVPVYPRGHYYREGWRHAKHHYREDHRGWKRHHR